MVAPLLSVVPESLARFRRGVIPLVPRLPKSTRVAPRAGGGQVTPPEQGTDNIRVVIHANGSA